MIVVKFGGTSLAGTERMRAAARIVAAQRRDQSVVCVVSAMAGVTDALIRIAEQMTTTTTGITGMALLDETRIFHLETITALTTTTTGSIPTIMRGFETAWEALEADLAHLRDTPFSSDEARAHAAAAFSGWGERLAVLLFSAALEAEGLPAFRHPGEPVVLVERRSAAGAAGEADAAPQQRPTGADVPWEWLAPSVRATREELAPLLVAPLAAGMAVVLPGYIAHTREGLVTTLGRNGSDASAAVVGAALGAKAVYLYSDVAGLRRTDPRVVPEAALLPALTYADAAELAALGAKVLHPATLRPLVAAGIPLHLRSAFEPEAQGSNIVTAAHLAEMRAGSDAADGASAGHTPWVVVAHPVSANNPLLSLRSEADLSGLVEVTGVFLRHAEMEAREDDHLESDVSLTPIIDAAGRPDAAGTGPVSGALALLNEAPLPIALSLSARRIRVAVPAEDAPATQRRLYHALLRADERSGRQLMENTEHEEQAAFEEAAGEWRRTS
ncbi:MAG: amino acid kinase family protein [Ktedonobacterales bacterium]